MATAPYGNSKGCTPCGRMGQRVAADMFCVNCDEYYCSPCLSHHRKFTPTMDHDLQEVSESGQPNKAVYLRDIHLEAPSDTETTASITSILRLSDGRFLVCDWFNKSLKLLDSVDYTVVGDLRLPDKPHTLCAVNNNEVAVSLKDKKKVIFVTTDSGLCISNRQPVNTKEACRGLLYLNGELYVASGGYKGEDPGKVEIYATSGSRVIEKDTQSGQRIFGSPWAFVINSTGSEITVTDYKKGITTINPAGQVMRRRSYPDLVGVRGACTDGAGRVFVVGKKSHNVIMLDQYGAEKVLLSQSDGVAKPMDVCFDPVRKRLLVGMDDERALRVFNLQYPIPGVQEITVPTE